VSDDQPDPRRYHFVELGAPEDLVALIDAEAQRVSDYLNEPGRGGLLMCIAAVGEWQRILEEAGWQVFSEGKQLLKPGYTMYGGYQLSDAPAPEDHHWLVVGPAMTLFDPTAGQYAEFGPPAMERYIASDGLPFVESRRRRLR
jgi:hypothetical protein